MLRPQSRLDLDHGAAGRLARSSRLVGRDREQVMSFAAMMVHLDVERDCEQRVQLALDLADRFQAALIGIAGLALRPAFAAGGIVVYGEKGPGKTPMLAQALNCLEFFEAESCGKCVPCRLGCQQLVQLTVTLSQGRGDPAAVRQTVETLGQVMELTSICGLGRSAPNPLLSVLEHFPGEVSAPRKEAPR